MNKILITLGGISLNLGVFFSSSPADTLISIGVTLFAVGVVFFMIDDTGW